MATRTWTGGHASSDNWTQAANWGGVAPSAGDDLVFAGSTRLTPNNDFAAGTSFASITFDSTAGAFTLGGNQITLTGNVTDSSSNNQTINIAIILNVATCTVTVANTVIFGGVISETGGARNLTVASGAGEMVVTATNTFTGTATIDSGGTLRVGNGSTIGRLLTVGSLVDNGTLIFNRSGSTDQNSICKSVTSGTGTLEIISGTITVRSNTLSGGSLITGTGVRANALATDSFGTGDITIDNGAAMSSWASNYITNNIIINADSSTPTTNPVLSVGGGSARDFGFSGNITLNADATVGSAGVSNLNITGSISGSYGITVYSLANTTRFTGSNSYTGKTYIKKGRFEFNSVKNVGGGNSALGAPTTAANGTIAIGADVQTPVVVYTGTGDTTDRVIDLAGTTGDITIEQGGTGLLKFTSACTASGSGAKTLTLDGSTVGTGEIAGAIVDSSGGATTLVKDGTSKWTLSAACTYTGTTTINGGELSVAGLTSNITVNVGCTLSGGGTVGTITGTDCSISLGTAGSCSTMTAGDVTLSGACNIYACVSGTGPTSDKLASTGTITLSAETYFYVDGVDNPAQGNVYTILDATTALSGTFISNADGTTINVSNRVLRLNYTAKTVTLTDVGGRDLGKILLSGV